MGEDKHADLKAKLRPAWITFCQEYAVNSNGSRSYKAAYKTVKKDSTAEVNASKLLRNAKVVAYIDALKADTAAKLEVTAERVLAEYAKMAFVNPQDFYDENGSLRPIHELSKDTAAAIAGMDVKEFTDKEGNSTFKLHKIKIADKKGNLDSIGKYLGMFIEKTENVHKIAYEDLTDEQLQAQIAALESE